MGKVVQTVSHGPAAQHVEPCLFIDLSQRLCISDNRKIQRRHPDQIYCQPASRLPGRPPGAESVRYSQICVSGAPHIGTHAVCLKSEAGDACPLLYDPCDPLKIRAQHVGHGTSAEGDKTGMGHLCCLAHIVYETLVAAHDSVRFRKPGNIDHGVDVIPPGFVVGVICGVASRGVVHDAETVQLVQGGAYAVKIRGIVRKYPSYISHCLFPSFCAVITLRSGTLIHGSPML